MKIDKLVMILEFLIALVYLNSIETKIVVGRYTWFPFKTSFSSRNELPNSSGFPQYKTLYLRAPQNN